MKILHVINNLGSGGAEKLLTDMLPLMVSEGHDVSLLVLNHRASLPRYIDILKASKINIINLNNSFYSPLSVFAIIFLLRKHKYDIVHGHLFPSQYWLAFASIFRLKQSKFFKTEHSVHNERKQYRVLRPLERFVYTRFDSIIGITEKVTANLAEWLSMDNRIVTVKNGVNIQQIESSHQIQNSDDYVFLQNDLFNILMVARFDGWQKDQISLVRAIPYMPESVHVYFAGEGPFLEKVKDEVISLGLTSKVTFLGLRTDVYTLMHLVNLNVLSSNHEGLSGVTLEGLASGQPFIGSDVEGINDVVPNGLFLFPKADPYALGSKVTQIIENAALREELIVNGKSHARLYDISVMTSEYLNLYLNNHANGENI